MENKGKIVKIFTGDKVSIQRLKSELESNGIKVFLKDEFKQGLEAGFVGGVPNVIELFVVESDVEKANEIKKAILE